MYPMYPMNIKAESFVPKNYQSDMEIERKWYEDKMIEFECMNKFIFEDEADLEFILSLKNTPFENVRGERFKEKAKFKPTLCTVRELVTWADIVA